MTGHSIFGYEIILKLEFLMKSDHNYIHAMITPEKNNGIPLKIGSGVVLSD